jgi:hypothetical protein
MATLAVDTVSPGRIYAHRFLLVALLGTQRLTGRMTSAEVKAWREWIRGADGLTNPAYVPGDPLPALAEIAYWLRHPRWFLRRAAAA